MKSPIMNSRFVKVLALLLILATVGSLAGCGSGTNMPYNGDTAFHGVSAEIPGDFIRDSVQSNEDLWLFEKDFYSAYIILSRQDITADAEASIDGYIAYMQEQGVAAQRETFLQKDAVSSTYTQDGMFCQEILFAHNGSFYTIALRGGTEEEFQSLLATVKISDTKGKGA